MKCILIIITIITALPGCGRKIECTDPPIPIAFISFPTGDIDTLVLRKYTPGNAFQNLVDTFQVNTANSRMVRFGDTAHVSLSNPDRYIVPGYDWQIFIPAISRTVSITHIVKEDRTYTCAAMSDDCFCNDIILSLKVDNQIQQPQTSRGNGLFIR